jgi:hypothetical protein
MNEAGKYVERSDGVNRPHSNPVKFWEAGLVMGPYPWIIPCMIGS